jgi:hypothetical protein
MPGSTARGQAPRHDAFDGGGVRDVAAISH